MWPTTGRTAQIQGGTITLDRLFKLSENGTTVRTELMGGLTTFLTMAYIVFLRPAILSVDFAGNPTGLDHGAVLAMGFVTYPVIKALAGKRRQVSWLMVTLAVVLLGYFILVRTHM